MSEEVIHRTFYNKEYNVEFYNTPKAGMTTMLRTIPLEFQPLDGLPPKRKVCCVLRDPVSRFISGFGHLGLHGSTDCKIREWNREGIMGSAFLYARVTQATRKQAFFNYLHEIELKWLLRPPSFTPALFLEWAASQSPE